MKISVIGTEATKKATHPDSSQFKKWAPLAKKLWQCVRVALNVWGVTDPKNPPGPIYAQFGISDPCNHKCVMCGDHPPDDHKSATTEGAFARPPGIMSFKHFKSSLDDLKRMGTPDIEIVGQGEPMLNKDLVNMVRYAKENEMYVRMVSNGSRLFKQQAEELVDMGLNRLHISLNAGRPDTYPKIHVTESPENYLKVKTHLRQLSDYKNATQSTVPYLRLGFVIGSRNCDELEDMVRVVHEVGAEEGVFNHVVVHEGTQDLKMTEDQYRALMAQIPRAQKLAEELGIRTNLKTFAATQPNYMYDYIEGPRVVPCYVGSYFTQILGNGSVLPCCQCSEPLGEISDTETFQQAWVSDEYNAFRDAARALPKRNNMLDSCECDHCFLRPRNISLHNMLHPFSKVKGTESDMLYRVSDLFKSRKADKD